MYNEWCRTLQKDISLSLKVGLSPFKKDCAICLIENPLKMVKNAFHSILKAFSVPKMFKFLSRLFGHVEKTAWL